MFDKYSSLSSLPDISKWNTNNVNNMFNNCSSLTSLSDISNWNINYIPTDIFLGYKTSLNIPSKFK